MGKPRGGNYHWVDNHIVRATRFDGKFTDLVEKDVKIQVFKSMVKYIRNLEDGACQLSPLFGIKVLNVTW